MFIKCQTNNINDTFEQCTLKHDTAKFLQKCNPWYLQAPTMSGSLKFPGPATSVNLVLSLP